MITRIYPFFVIFLSSYFSLGDGVLRHWNWYFANGIECEFEKKIELGNGI